MRYKKLDVRISRTALDVLCALCADYPRRKRIIDCQFRTVTTDEEINKFKRINEIIDDSLRCVDEGIRMYVLTDIANRNGYNKSMASPFISHMSYYRQKNEVLLRMAQKFNLII